MTTDQKDTDMTDPATTLDATEAPADGHTPEQVPVYIAWNRVMADVRAIAKDGENKFQRFFFRGIDAVMNAVGPIFRKHGVFVLPVGVEAKHRDFQSKEQKLQHEAILTVDYVIYGPMGDSMPAQSIGEAADSSDKATTQAMSVAYRTLLLQGLTMPTDDKDPDENTVDRVDGGPAKALGWDGQAALTARWDALVAHPQVGRADVLSWGQAKGLSPDTLTPALADEWQALMDAPTEGQQAAQAEGWAEPTKTDGTTDAAVPPPAEEFDKAAAWAMLHPLHNNVPDGKRFDEIQVWIEATGLNEDSITQETAAEFYNRITAAGVDPSRIEAQAETAAATEAPTTLKAAGWKSKAERTRTWDSLLSRQQGYSDEVSSKVIARVTAEIGAMDESTLTKEQSITWLQILTELSEEPFS